MTKQRTPWGKAVVQTETLAAVVLIVTIAAILTGIFGG